MEYHLLDITDWRLEAKGVETALPYGEGTFMQRSLLAGKPNVYPLSWTGLAKLSAFWDVMGRLFGEFSPDIISINRERDIIQIVLTVKLLGLLRRNSPKLVSVFHNSGWKKNRSIYLSLLRRNNLSQCISQGHAIAGRQRSSELRCSGYISRDTSAARSDSAKKLNPRPGSGYFFKGRSFPINRDG